MVAEASKTHNSEGFLLVEDYSKIQSGIRLEKIILDFMRNPPNIPKRDFVIARNQILSLFRRMKYHPENIVLCKFYENRIKQIIQLEKGKEK